MSILADINALQNKKSLFDSIYQKEQLDMENKYKLEILKEDMLNILSNIFSVYSTNVVSNSFYLQVNQVENNIYELIKQKNKELKLLETKKEKILCTIKNIFSSIYLILLIENNIHISINIEKRLLDLKNNILNININKKRECALDFVEKKLPIYITNLKLLIQIVSEFSDKKSLPFEKRQEIFGIFNDISLNIQFDKNHSKMFNEDLSINDTSTLDYIKWYENIFLCNCDNVGLNLNSYYTYLCQLLSNSDVSTDSIINVIDEFIAKKYNADIKSYHEAITNFLNKSTSEIKMQLLACFTCEDNSNLENIIQEIKDKNVLPSYLNNIKNKDFITNILSQKKFNIKNNIATYYIKDELYEIINNNFNFDDYLDIYYANLKYKNKQIAGFRIYYNDVLEKSKKQLMEKYIDRINKIIEIQISNTNNIFNIEKEYNAISDQIEELNQALEYINTNYRDFNENNLKLYLSSIEHNYSVKHLYERISSKNSNILYRIKSKRVIKKELPFLENFINNTDILNSLKNTIITSIINSNELKLKLNSM